MARHWLALRACVRACLRSVCCAMLATQVGSSTHQTDEYSCACGVLYARARVLQTIYCYELLQRVLDHPELTLVSAGVQIVSERTERLCSLVKSGAVRVEVGVWVLVVLGGLCAHGEGWVRW